MKYRKDVSYTTWHAFLNRVFGIGIKCEFCGKIRKITITRNGRKRGNIHWALKHGRKYSRNPNDYFRLCIQCHRKYDYRIIFTKEHSLKQSISQKENFKTWRIGWSKKAISAEQANDIRKLYQKGFTQCYLAKKYNIHQTTIHNILYRKFNYMLDKNPNVKPPLVEILEEGCTK